MPTPSSDQDTDLAIALAEYSHLNELRNQLEQKSASRFNFFLALSTAVAAVAAGLLTQLPQNSAVIWVVATLGVVVLAFGFSNFLRQIRFTGRSVRLTAAQIALRTYLARRSPEVRPYLLLPVESDRGVMPGGKMGWLNQSLGLPGITALLNSAMLGLAVGLALGLESATAMSISVAALAFLVTLTGQVAYIGRVRAEWTRDITAVNKQRGITG